MWCLKQQYLCLQYFAYYSVDARVSSEFLQTSEKSHLICTCSEWFKSFTFFSKCLLSLKRMNTNYLSSQMRKEKHVSGTFALLETYPRAGGSLKAVRQDAACHSNESTFFFFWVGYQKGGICCYQESPQLCTRRLIIINSFRNTEHALNYQCTRVLLLYLA